MKTICLYHRIDLDGWMSAAIVKYYYSLRNKDHNSAPTLFEYTDITFEGYTYGDKIPNVSNYDRIIMCDMSLLKGVMEQLHEDHSKEIIWIDHHKSAIEDSERPLKYNDLKGIRDINFAACELTWKYFFPMETMPEIVRLLGRYDCFGHKGTDEEQKVLEFQYGARQYISNYEEAYKYLLQSLGIRKTLNVHPIEYRIREKGIVIYQYLCTEAKQAYKNGFEIQFYWAEDIGRTNGVPKQCFAKFIAINRERFNPINFNIDYHKDGYDGAVCFHFNGTHWCFSLYNDNGLVDCYAIAKQFGGGGHAGASGFILPFGDKIDSFFNPRKA